MPGRPPLRESHHPARLRKNDHAWVAAIVGSVGQVLLVSDKTCIPEGGVAETSLVCARSAASVDNLHILVIVVFRPVQTAFGLLIKLGGTL